MISFWHLLQENELKTLQSFARRYVCRFRCTLTYKYLQSFSANEIY